MAELSRDPVRGSDILTAFKRLIADVRRERIVSVDGGTLRQMDGGRTLVIHNRGNVNIKKPFDIADKATDTFSVMDNQGRGNFARILNVKLIIGLPGGTPFTWDGSLLKWTHAAITASTFVYLRFERGGTPSIYLESGASVPDGDDDTNYTPLWYIPWVAVSGDVPAHIDWASRVDMRFGVDVSGMV